MGFHGFSKIVFFFVCEHFPPALLIALSVVSMELWSPHKMAEIRHRHSNAGVLDPRIGNLSDVWLIVI